MAAHFPKTTQSAHRNSIEQSYYDTIQTSKPKWQRTSQMENGSVTGNFAHRNIMSKNRATTQ